MPKSKLRGGKKAHNKRVKLRNEKIISQRKKLQQEYENIMKVNYDEFLKNSSGVTETDEVTETSGITLNSGESNVVSETVKPAEINMDYKPTNPTQGLLK
jgi:hypothetical protein